MQRRRLDLVTHTHHGSKFGSSAALLAKIQPRFAVISAGANNTFTHPWPKTIERLQAPEAKTERIYCTIANGTITATISTSGSISWKTTEQAAPWWSRASGRSQGVCKEGDEILEPLVVEEATASTKLVGRDPPCELEQAITAEAV